MNPGHDIDPSQATRPERTIHFLKRREIDLSKWDACVMNAPNGLIYGRSFYLDAMAAGQWDALVLDDYQAVMPLTWRSKAGIRYLYQPAFTQQTGIFCRLPCTPALVDAFLHQLGRHFGFAEIFLNYGNAHPSLQKHRNFTLPLKDSYEILSGCYKENLVRNLKKPAISSLNYLKEIDFRIALQQYRHEYASRNSGTKGKDYRNFEKLCFIVQNQGMLLTRAITDHQKQVLASAVLFRDAKRLFLLLFTTLPEGRQVDAGHFLIDRLVREWAASGLILDFEGSDHPGVARFYHSFGSLDQPYFFYRHNQLRWPLRWLK